MKTIQTTKAKLLVVPVPKGGNQFCIGTNFYKTANYLQYHYSMNGVLTYDSLSTCNFSNWKEQHLPIGNYTLLGRPSEISEERAIELVEPCINQAGYEDYMNVDLRKFTAKESLSSLLLSYGISDKDSVVLLKINE